ncbi:MAG: hypothetical protein PSN34_10020 [Urechidicola sp.]|nr:hypothetical protein [Urechidicola sp.]
MSRQLVTVFVITFFTLNLYAQEKPKTYLEHSNFQIGLGSIFTSFQDVKYSKVHYNGVGVNLNFGYKKIKRSYFTTNLNLIYSNENAKTHNSGKTTVLNGIIDVSYLKPILKKDNQKLYIGAKWEVLDIYFRQTENLGNNGIFFTSGSNLKFASLYEKTISDKLKLRAGFNFQLLSFIKESTSFGFSAPQSPLEDGEFSYQNEKLEALFGFKYYSLEPFTKYLNIDTKVEMHYKKRWVFTYKWNMQRSNKVKNYPMTRGSSALSVQYKF